MKKFIFTARDQQGKMITGGEEAENADALVSRLQLRGLLVTNIRVQSESGPAVTPKVKFAAGAHRFSHHRIKEEDLCLFGRQLATAIGSGVPLLKSMDIISRQAASKKLFDVLNAVTHDVETGMSFRDALAKHPKVFSSLWVNLVETGEASGNLPLVLERLVAYIEARAAFKRKIVSALIYPAILTLVALAAIVIFLMVVVPKFVTIFQVLNQKLPLPTQVLIAVSNLLTKNFPFIFIVSCGILYAGYQYARSRAGKAWLDHFVLSAPAVREFFRLAEIEKFASGMSTLLESGVPILFSLEIAERSSGNSLVQDIIKGVKESVREGKPLVGPMEESGFFPPMITQMVNIGEEIGELDKMFKKIAGYYSEMLETKITRLTTMFEPIMIVFMGVVIGGMVISMFVPIFSIANMGAGK